MKRCLILFCTAVIAGIAYPCSAQAIADTNNKSDSTAKSQPDSLLVDSQANEEVDIPKSDYSYLYVGGGAWSDSLNEGSIGGVILGYNQISNKIAYEWHLPGVGKFITFKSRRENARVMSTFLIQSIFIAVPAWTGLITRREKFFVGTLLPLLQLPFGSHLAIRPLPDVAIFAGVMPDFMLFTDDDGILWRYRVGCRFLVPKTWAAVEILAVKSRFNAWEQEKRTFGWSFGVNCLIDPKFWKKNR